jgi:hypothetical protein
LKTKRDLILCWNGPEDPKTQKLLIQHYWILRFLRFSPTGMKGAEREAIRHNHKESNYVE